MITSSDGGRTEVFQLLIRWVNSLLLYCSFLIYFSPKKKKKNLDYLHAFNLYGFYSAADFDCLGFGTEFLLNLKSVLNW